MQHILLGAHLERGDIPEDITSFPLREIFASAIELAHGKNAADREVIAAATAARARMIEREVFVAIRYGATASDAPEVERKCGEHAVLWQRLLTEHRGRVELTLKAGAPRTIDRPEAKNFRSGGDYLRALAQSRATELEPEFRDGAERAFAFAIERQWERRPEGAWELALLVDRGDLDRAAAAGEALRESSPGIPFLLSGPWPLEVFARE